MIRRARAFLAAALVSAAPMAAHAEDDPALGFVHVEANVGGASGGHTALRLGDRVWHYQLGEERLLELKREDWETFRFKYNVLQNRPLHVARVPVDSTALSRVRDHLNTTHLAQQRERNQVAELRRDLALVEALNGQRAGVPTRGAGLLDPELASTADATQLAIRIGSRLDAGLEAALTEANRDVAALSGHDPAAWREALSWRGALNALHDAAPLDANAAIQAPSEMLSDAERASFRELRRVLEATMLRLVESRRPDRGTALWVALARHRAAGLSLERGRAIFVDPLPDDAHVLEGRDIATRRDELAAVADFLDGRLRRVRGETLDGRPPSERRLARLEALVARAVGYRHSAETGEPVREAEGRLLVPERSRDLPLPPSLVGAPAPAEAGPLQMRLAEAEARRTGRWSYELFTDNCVTALAESLDDALGGPDAVRAALGDHVASDELLAFWPLVYFGKVARRLRIADIEVIESLRTRRLDALRADAGALGIWARESNTLSSSIYRRRDADGSFLLFTDGAVWARPLFGALNLAWATADAGYGLLAAPFDRGRRLERAGKGMLFSIPELFFVNIRKGTFDAQSLDLAARDDR